MKTKRNNYFTRIIIAGFLLTLPFYGIATQHHTKIHTAQVQKEDPLFETLIDQEPELITIYDKGIWLEGPQALPDGSLIWSDVKANRVLRWQEGEGVSVFLEPSHFQNGHALDNEGRLLAASHGKRAIERLEKDGKWMIVIDAYQGHKLNSPNDIIVDRSGDIWFTDPAFGINNPKESYGGTAVQGGDYSYRYSPKTGTIVRLKTPLVKAPNGIALSPDEKTLYIADSELAYNFNSSNLNSRIVAYTIKKDKSLKNGRVLATVSHGIPDGIATDAIGNIWSSSEGSIQIFSPKGKRLGKIILPGTVSNMNFSLDKANNPILYVTASHAIYRLKIKVKESKH
ncbi:SMP-30/gluconolactonase/LRE family protein [Xylella taiwanensis]|uniref:Gluconolactonase n=1 Tax=Xylella taiwanensis TaxID=1444770 RepID=Z9JKL9_9GAMM|nr:SMP-30/gluconolactonase/LRE family protein [Xylella taiwanensis]AXI83086.1 gluconolactonase [Xylella taiwanensis]EWS78724.1 gluconolactonase [Xylella taiwanensis]MCD8456120.1 SMP-30/gluconolactonase/LRE family protein [Xylella taiwanensis]MCD8458525.1 SMP-30/gluconolactonase/LRE family protein [Xylella taiwanensis]MCD8460660.1 SMP-30/gluconolactonase/LRE family protein [Xylella taiwanensis]